jgi:uncharacterized protein (TIGR03083 family)
MSRNQFEKPEKTRAVQRRYLMARLAAERAGLLEQLHGLDESALTELPVFEGWSVKDVLAHIAAWDRWEERTMQSIVAGQTPDFAALQDFDVTNAAIVATWRERTLDEVLAELLAARADWTSWLASVPDEEFFRPRSYAGHDWTFSVIPLRVQWQHDAEHAQHIADWRGAEGLEGTAGTKTVLLAALDAAREELMTAAALVPVDERTSRAVCGEWTLKDVLGHVADWEWYGVAGLRQMVAGQPPEPEAIGDLEIWNATHADARRDQSWGVVWGDLHAARQSLLQILRRMSQSEMARSFPFPWGSEGAAYQWAGIFVEHDREHAKDLRKGGD